MKKYIKFVFTFALMFAFSNVKAAVLYTCDYSFNPVGSEVGRYTWKITVNTDFSYSSNYSILNPSETIINSVKTGSGYDDEIKKIISSAKQKQYTCPTLLGCVDGIGVAQVFSDKKVSDESISCDKVAGIKKIASNAPSEVKTTKVCTRTFELRSSKKMVEASFYTVGNEKKWSMNYSGDAVGTLRDVNESQQIDSYIFSLSSGALSQAFDNCKKSLFLECLGGDQGGKANITIVNSKPIDSNNCQYSSSKVDEDEGEEEYDPNQDGNLKNDKDKVNTIRTCISCGEVLDNVPANLPKFSRGLIIALQTIVPALLVLLGMYDFIRAITSNDDKAMKETQSRFIKRIIAAVMIFLVVAIVKFAFALVPNDTDVLGCIPCFISNENSCGSSYDCK